MSGLASRLADRIARHGPLSYEAFIEAALYDEMDGFFASGGVAGRGGDFLTSPEVGPLFGAVLARALDLWWDELGRPDPYVVVDAGAGPATLARSVLAAAPSCTPALRPAPGGQLGGLGGVHRLVFGGGRDCPEQLPPQRGFGDRLERDAVDARRFHHLPDQLAGYRP